MKKIIVILAILLLAGAVVFAQGAKETSKALKVGMVTDAGTIDDKSFNQGTWEGILRAEKDLGLDIQYLKPSGTTEAHYLSEIGNLYDAGYKFIITPGFKFETAIYVAQDRYKDAKFVILDGEPHSADYSTYRIEKNVVGVYWLEHQSGFVAGVAAALQIKTGDFGFIGGMEIPAVQKFNWGFQQGVAYANKNFGTSITMKAENVLYQGSFDNVAAGQQLAASMYDKGVKVIFAAAGGVGVGVINEAKNRASSGQNVWVVGVDVDQYNEGLLPNGKSIILTSAMKYLDRASYEMIQLETEGKFPGGQIFYFDATSDSVGIPVENPNLGADVTAKVNEVYAQLKAGKITVADNSTGLLK
ncbi:BMP family lipoprotein [Parasphaerochaeta coccoides]|uniref:Nucleoside-binding protein n=1 Tax=Parasphaerochaeta coccoides (strain ATCC BAA-1237 / DSM 17374 / SPN1) TaxID=760011 RepID=F4GJ09_PARC1|nr:BMP family ABC transporter substrate-binding protein [Parasphaerochaeta coccoides]AEC01304.1 nucleoside-binding protein [Parasphaerochaeta coccoides DSM 17374]